MPTHPGSLELDRDSFEEEFSEDYPDASEEQIEAAWQAEQTRAEALPNPVEPPDPPERPERRPASPERPNEPVELSESEREYLLRAAGRDDDFVLEQGAIGVGSGGARKRRGRQAVRVTSADGTRSFRDIGNDEAAIREFLGGRDYRPALRRGRRTAERDALCQELIEQVATLRELGATQRAIAQALGCHERVVGVLLRAAPSK